MYKTNPGCPEYTIVSDLDIKNFTGIWFEMYVSNFENIKEENEKQCSTFKLTA